MPDVRLLLGVLAAVAVLAAIGRRYRIPDPIAFALGGLVLALVPGLPVVALPPRLVLAVFLPPLIFAAAQDTSWAELRRETWPILLLAVGLVLVTTGTVAVAAHSLAHELTWPAAFALGAIVAPPDSVAAKAIADTLRLPRRTSTTVHASSSDRLTCDTVSRVRPVSSDPSNRFSRSLRKAMRITVRSAACARSVPVP